MPIFRFISANFRFLLYPAVYVEGSNTSYTRYHSNLLFIVARVGLEPTTSSSNLHCSYVSQATPVRAVVNRRCGLIITE